VFFFLLIGSYFGRHVRVNLITYFAVLADVVFLALWFGLAPDMSFIDWTFAFKHGYPAARVLQDFLISHVVGRVFVGVTFWSLFRE
jgi:hypothetical protein